MELALISYIFFLDNNNRVKLIADASIPGSDYINASYVSVSSYFYILYIFIT